MNRPFGEEKRQVLQKRLKKRESKGLAFTSVRSQVKIE